MKANPDLVVVDLEAGHTVGTTEIEYWKAPNQTIWHRWNDGAWQPVELGSMSSADPAHSHGTYLSYRLKPGWIYEVTIWPPDVDPNDLADSEPPLEELAHLAVFALKKRSEPRSFFKNGDEVTGGTYRTEYVSTGEDVYAYMWVGTDRPKEDGVGYLTLTNFDGSDWSSEARSSHALQVRDRLPGNEYHGLIRLSNADGDWEFLTREFKTRERKVKIKSRRSLSTTTATISALARAN